MSIDKDLIDISWKNLSEMFDRYQRVDSKVLGVITVCGVLISLMVDFTKDSSVNGSVTVTTITIPYNWIIAALFSITAVLFIITISLCAYMLRSRDTTDINTKNVYEQIKKVDGNDDKAISILLSTIIDIEDIWSGLSSQKASDFRKVMFSLALSVTFLIISITIQTILKLNLIP